MGVRERREREKEQRRIDILQAARKVFWKKGFHRALMNDVAKVAELAPGTLYLYFKSKEALYVELLAEGYELLAVQLESAIRKGATPKKKAEKMIDAFFRFATDEPSYFDILFFVAQQSGRRPEHSLSHSQLVRLDELESACKAVVIHVLKETGKGLRRAALSETVDVIWGMLGGIVLFFKDRKPREFRKVASRARKVILDSIFSGK